STVFVRLYRYSLPNPPADCGELDAVRLMPHSAPVVLQLRHDVPAYGAGLNTSPHILTLDPNDPIHPPHVDREDRPMFALVTAKGVGDVCTAAIGYQSDVVRLCSLDESCDLSLCLRIDD